MAKKGTKHSRNEKAILIVGKNIRRYREQSELTIMQLADKLDVDYSQISRIERGIVNTNISVIFDIAEVLNIDASKLLEEDNQENLL